MNEFMIELKDNCICDYCGEKIVIHDNLIIDNMMKEIMASDGRTRFNATVTIVMHKACYSLLKKEK